MTYQHGSLSEAEAICHVVIRPPTPILLLLAHKLLDWKAYVAVHDIWHFLGSPSSASTTFSGLQP